MAELSAEVFTIPLESGRYIVYAPLRQVAFVANSSAVNAIVDIKEGACSSQLSPDSSLIELLRQLEIIDAGPEPQPITEFSGTPEPTEITLFLTTTCNLRCTYCYASAGETPAKNMPIEVAMRGIDFVAGNAVKKSSPTFEVNYHGGGEPTGNWRVLTDSLAYARSKASALGLAPPVASAASNGILRDDQIDWILANLNGGVSVSFDGLPAAHDRHRLTVLGGGSSDRVIRTLRRFDAAGYVYGIRVTVTTDQIADLPDSVEFICSNFATRSIQVEPAYQMGRWRSAVSAETDDFVAAYRVAQERAAGHGRRISFSAARIGILTNHFCGLTQDLFALTPDGHVSSCYEAFSEDNRWAKTFFYGSPHEDRSGYRFELPVLNNLRRQAVQHRKFCQGCFAKWTCAGDCYHKAVSVTGETEFRGTDRCHITRELTKDQILANIAESGGLVWRGSAGGMQGQARGKEGLL